MILALRDAVAAWLVGRGIAQWSPGDYPLDRIEKEIDREEWYVVEDESSIVGAIRVTWSDPRIWSDDAAAGYIHGLMVDRRLAGASVGGKVLKWAESFIVSSGRRLARLDCVTSNNALRAYYRDRGYAEVGIVEFEPGLNVLPVMRFQKALT